ncbi:TPA: hypothetical protein N2C02_003546 [Pseudomonas aeruginosa]|uniref:enzyme n=2 Tax=Pseudomonas TaxID=286 RepID=UPI0002A3892E|nr:MULTISPECIES: enzyme [unclassified Pseudomonas]HCL3953208.1 hypothetical protein [Pseudomonas aeruginosa]MBB1605411.1 hypothetical protein [Pseudomonas sp. UMC76]MBB1641356.1 hypothetical protein [Pseudomonas sp. UME83]NTX89389.1 SMP-30/gluconolactonase/LRE family protein [Pseudomonas sp. UMA643]NTY19304.1 SMP-30/gluconolactonase/LRE family protein [Pseudomonas sp. UMC3103]
MILDPILDLFRSKAVTIPPLDGAFRPNTALDDAPLLARLADADNLVVRGGELLASSGNALYRLDAGGAEPLASFPAAVTALAVAPDGALAIALDNGTLLIDGEEQPLPAGVRCITALAFAANGELWLANGAAERSPADWANDLMLHGSSGSLWKRPPGAARFAQVAGDLAFPYGLLPVGEGGIVFTESWRHRLVRLDASGRRVIADKLPGYPARLAPAQDGGAWLALFAPRNRLIEFVLREQHYRLDMLAQVPRAFWIAPALSSGRSFLEPLQCGGIKTMGVHKPWAPSRSYGLLVRLDAALRPTASLHSRADGQRHGICSAVEHAGRLLVASRGGDCIIDAGPLSSPSRRASALEVHG